MMGYTIIIGEARIVSEPYDEEFHHPSVEAQQIELPDAPDLPNDCNPRCNYRWPSYGAWHDFVTTVGLEILFYGTKKNDRGGRDDEECLLGRHPGCVRLTEDHQKRISEALASYRAKFPDVIPGWVDDGGERLTEDERQRRTKESRLDPTLARLVWLEWWVRWALKNCKLPVISNS